jgi:hypothetical protein
MSGHELAILLGVKPRNMLTQLGEWTRLGFFTRTGFGTYKLNTPPASTPRQSRPTLNFAALLRDPAQARPAGIRGAVAGRGPRQVQVVHDQGAG